MTYREAMKQKCKCGKFFIGGWIGTKRNGLPSFTRISGSRVFYPCILMYEEHTIDVCYAPQRIA